MKIKEFAAENGVTQGAVYKAIGRAGYSARDLTDKRGNITTRGMKTLRGLFSDAENPASEPPKEPEADNSTIDDLRERLRAAQEQAEKWQRLYLELQEQSARERAEHREEMREAHIIASQALNRNPLKRLFGRKKAQEAEGSIS